jgi:pyrroloquinoline quinone biosynthesis protein B
VSWSPRATLACASLSVLSVSPWPVSGAEPGVRAVVLGIAQDGGVPHIGCHQELCVAARRDPGRRQRVASLGLIDDRAGARFLIDATPDLPSQIESLNEGRKVADPRRPVDGILLTHAHMGHYAGLLQLGREALGANAVPVYATPRLARFLRDNGPWSQLVALGNVELRAIEPGHEFALTPDLSVTALTVPHRDEWSDTVGFVVRGPSARLLYVPDIDKWEKWERRLEDEVARVDVALLDGTFHSLQELPGRSQAEVPHPLVGETSGRLAQLSRRVVFIHLNHTNRLLFDPRARAQVEAKGFRVARDGEVVALETTR